MGSHAEPLRLPYANTETVNLHLAEISRAVSPNAHAALVADGAGRHVGDRLVIPDNITLVQLPPYAAELNPIENVWAHLRGTTLAHRLFDSFKDIVDACCDAWNSLTADPATVRSITTRRWATRQKT